MANLHCECQELKTKVETNSSCLVLHPSSCVDTVNTVGSHLNMKDNTLLTDQKSLEKLMASEWNDRISHHSLTTLHGKKFNQIDLLALTEDLEKQENNSCKEFLHL